MPQGGIHVCERFVSRLWTCTNVSGTPGLDIWWRPQTLPLRQEHRPACVPWVRDHGTHGQDVRGDGGPHRGPAGGRRQVRRDGRARVPVQCWRAHHLARRPAPLPARLWLCLTRRAGSTAPHRSWTAAEEEEEYLGAAGRAKPAAGRRVKQKGGWTEEEDGRLVRRVFGGAGWMCAAARGLVCPGPAAPSGRRDVAAPA